MRLELTGRQVDITPRLRRLVDKKLARIERMLNDRALSTQVVLSRPKQGFRADVTLHARGEKFLHGVGGPLASWETALSQAVEKIVQQAQRIKGKWETRRRRAPEKGVPGLEAPGAARTRPAAEAPPERPRMPRVLRAWRQPLTSMSVADAVRAAEAAENGAGVIVFRNEETAAISVLYRAGNGELTLVEADER